MKKEKHIGLLSLGIALAGIMGYYQYWQWFRMLPEGSHLWRQADCMAMVWNYKLFHLSFFHPASFNLQSVQGNVAGEFPLFYYLAAQTESPELALRLMHTMVFLGGLVSVYFIAFYFLRHAFLSVCVAVLFFTSPLLVFYGNNFLSDVPAWSFAMMGWAVYFNKREQEGWLWFTCLFFSMATLLKASQAINFAISFIFPLKIQDVKLSFSRLIPYALFMIPLSWYLYARSYNSTYHNNYYFLSIFPIWKMKPYDIGLCIWRMAVSWSDNYCWRPFFILLTGLFLYACIKGKIINAELKRAVSLSLLFTLLYLLLFFERMKLHEYYYVLFFLFFVFVVITAVSLLIPFADKKGFRLILMFFLLVNIFYCKHRIDQKLQDQPYNGTLAGDDFQTFLKGENCTINQVVISLPDPSVNQSLYWIKRKGYTAYNNYLSVLKKREADFLLISSEAVLKDQALQPYLQDSIGDFHGVRLYKLSE